MEEKKQSLSSAAAGYGLLIGVAVIIFSLIVFLLDVDKKSWINYFSYVIIVVGIFLAQSNYKNKHLGGFISYGKAFNVGFITIIFTSILVAIWTFIFFNYIDPGAMDDALRAAEEGMIERGMSDMEIDQAMKYVEKFQTPTVYTIFAVVGNIVIGLVISLITAIFVKKEDANIMPSA